MSATVTVVVTGPNGAVGSVTVGPDGKATVSIPHKKAVGTYTVKSTVSGPDTIVDCKRYGGSSGCEATDTIVEPPHKVVPYFDAMFGKERRERLLSLQPDIDPAVLAAAGPDAMFGQCSPLLGLKVGMASA
jgi:hypothetical protein